VHEHASFSGLPGHHPALGSFLGTPIRYFDQNLGTLYVGKGTGRPEFTEGDEMMIDMLAHRVAPAMEIARLRQVQIREQARLEFLAKAGPILSESIEYEPTLNALASLVVPTIADLSMIDVLQPDGSLLKIAVRHRDPAQQPLVEQLLGATSREQLPEDVRTAIETATPQRRKVTPEFLRDQIPEGTFREVVRAIGA